MSAAERNGDGARRGSLAPLAEVERLDRDGVVVVAVAGELDVSNVGALADVAYDVPNDALGLVLDLCAATYIDSATIGLLFRLRGSLQRRGQALRVVCVPESSTLRVLELTGFDHSTPIEVSREGAIEAIRREVPLGGDGAAES